MGCVTLVSRRTLSLVKKCQYMRPLLVLFLLCGLCALGQGRVPDRTCIHTDLSKTLTIITTARRTHLDEAFDSVRLTIRIIDKASKRLLQKISLTTFELFSEDYAHCRMVRSYSTGKNVKKEVIDDDYGDMIVADLNFDSREDLAFKTENNNGGTDYTFFTQTKDRKFVIDRFLTDSVDSYPASISRSRRTLTTLQRAGVRAAEHVYYLDPRTNKWSQIKYRIL